MTWTNLEHGGGGDSGVSNRVRGAQAAGLEGTLGETGAESVQESHHEAEQLCGGMKIEEREESRLGVIM